MIDREKEYVEFTKICGDCGGSYLAWNKEGFQIDEDAIDKIDKSREWEDSPNKE